MQWKHRVYAFIRREDRSLVSLSDKTTVDNEVAQWQDKTAKARYGMRLFLGDADLSKNRNIVEDNLTAGKELREELKRIFATCSQQPITNLQAPMKNMPFEENFRCGNHTSDIMSLIDKLESSYQPVTA